MRVLFAVILLAVASLAGCTDPDSTSASDCSKPDLDLENPMVSIDTNFGCIHAELFLDKVPITAGNFLDLASEGFYDGTKFHRIITDFMMQGGDPNSKNDDPSDDGYGGPGYAIPDEFHPDLRHDRPYRFSMANSGPNSGGSQFFITFVPTPQLDNKHAVFGDVVAGFDVVDRVNDEAATAQGVPTAKPVIVNKMTVHDYAPAPPAPADISADAITPGAFAVSSTTDQVLVWAYNAGGQAAALEWSLTGLNGSALPAGWSATFDPAGQEAGRLQAVHAMLTLTIPEVEAGVVAAELHTGHSTTPITVTVADSAADRVSKRGDAVTVAYAGRCTANDQPFDDGDFPLTLGGGRAIVGFDLGLIGMGLQEPQTIVIPAPMAYGGGGPCGSLNPADLTFEVSIKSFDG